MGYVLATTGSQVRWYLFNPADTLCPGKYQLVEALDLEAVPVFDDKAVARQAALALGLRTWRYVRL